MEIILILVLSIFVGIVVVCITKVYYNTNNRNNTTDENNRVDKSTVDIGDVFVYEPPRIISSDPFEDVSTVCDLDSSRTYIVDDLKINHLGVVWVKYHSLTSHRRKKCFYHTASIDAFLYRTYKHNELKYLFEE